MKKLHILYIALFSLSVAFFEKLALLFSTNIDTLAFDSLMPFIIRSPVVSSAAIPCTAQNIDLNGFWLIHRCFTLTSQDVSVTLVVRIPVQKTEGNLKKVNKVYLNKGN